MKITLGGERLGSGKKMDTALHNYGRSTHNLSQSWKSTIAPGVLVPFLKLLATNGDTFDIDLNAGLRTIPTKAPIYGSFKLQLDVFQCPIRLYQGILHNNPINIGMQMQNVKLPLFHIHAYNQIFDNDKDNSQVAPNALIKYLGVSGAGTCNSEELSRHRNFNGVPMLAYYDIFKNYYANKQEEKAYVITPNVPNGQLGTADAIERVSFISADGGRYVLYDTPTNNIIIDLDDDTTNWYNKYGTLTMIFPENVTEAQIKATPFIISDLGNTTTTIGDYWFDENNGIKFNAWIERNPSTNKMLFKIEFNAQYRETYSTWTEYNTEYKTNWYTTKLPIKIQDFDLKNIDTMREKLLSHHTLGTAFKINTGYDAYPYKANLMVFRDSVDTPTTIINSCAYPMTGLVLKTYQADIFNNWLQNEWINGDNGIAAVTSVDVSEGSLNLDALNLAQKIYNMLSRIAAAGGTYQDWQRAVYTDSVIMHAETPIWCGGMSSEIVFDEVVSTAETEGGDLTNALGGLAGKGTLKGKKGGKMHIKVNEPSYIIGIVSITPRIDYTQGNDFDMTDVKSIDDIHKPELDGIGFQDLLIERMAFWDAEMQTDGSVLRNAAGKIPAWLEYMTAVNKCYGDFARAEGKSYMVLNRNYEHSSASTLDTDVKDVTTYIDPAKYNYAFAVSELNAQNFWLQIVSDIKARRKMSAKIIPNL